MFLQGRLCKLDADNRQTIRNQGAVCSAASEASPAMRVQTFYSSDSYGFGGL